MTLKDREASVLDEEDCKGYVEDQGDHEEQTNAEGVKGSTRESDRIDKSVGRTPWGGISTKESEGAAPGMLRELMGSRMDVRGDTSRRVEAMLRIEMTMDDESHIIGRE